MMSNPGLGVMIQHLGGSDSIGPALTALTESKIASAALVKPDNGDNRPRGGNWEADSLVFALTDGRVVRIWDHGQSCCENRYMVCDDDLAAFVGETVVSVEVADAPSKELSWGEHEVQFLRILTTGGVITVATHNEHNGYYGGFAIDAEIVEVQS